MGIKKDSEYDGTKVYVHKGEQTEIFSAKRLAAVVAYFCVFLSIVWTLWASLPVPTDLTTNAALPNGWRTYVPPTSLDDAKGLERQLRQYIGAHYLHVMLVYVVTYIFLQTFAIPGSIFLSILAGALFSFPVALLLVCFCAAVGASCANILSLVLGQGLVEHYVKTRLEEWRRMVAKNRDNLFYFMLFLRITPMVPNFFVNIASPLVNVPLPVFFIGTFFGVALPSMLFIQLGQTLQQLTSTGLPWMHLGLLTLMGFLSLLPALYKDRIRRKFE